MTGLKDIFDQTAAVTFLAGAYKAQRLPHGLIFAGPEGVGKWTTALALAGVVLCPHATMDRAGGWPVACGKCDSCRAMTNEAHPDFHYVHRQLILSLKPNHKATELAIDVVREYLIKPANLKTKLGHGKVFVIEQAEYMSHEAQNALLKTLEEPQGQTLIILLTDKPTELLPTIHSRCQMVRFGGLAHERIVRELIGRGVESSIADDAARLAEGSLGIALKWSQEGVIEHARQLIRQLGDILDSGRPDALKLQGLINNAVKEYADRQTSENKQISRTQAQREAMLIYLNLIALVLRQRLRQTSDAQMLEYYCSCIDGVVRAEDYLESNVAGSLVLQQLGVCLEGQFAS